METLVHGAGATLKIDSTLMAKPCDTCRDDEARVQLDMHHGRLCSLFLEDGFPKSRAFRAEQGEGFWPSYFFVTNLTPSNSPTLGNYMSTMSAETLPLLAFYHGAETQGQASCWAT
jgi:hypothetical protein